MAASSLFIRMTRRYVLAAILVVLLLVICGGVFCGVERLNRSNMMNYGVSHLALWAELYGDDHRGYPSSLDELLLNGNPGSGEIRQILNDRFHDRYEYKPITNGFSITARGGGLLFYNNDVITTNYNSSQPLDRGSRR